MSKKNLIQAIATNMGTSKAEAERVVDAFVSGLTTELANGRDVTLVGFGAFKVKRREARVARNPQTGNSIEIGAKNVVTFKAGADLNREVQ